MDDALLPTGNQALGEASGLALFVLAIGILLWPLGRRLLEARRQRVHEARVASGLGSDERK